MDSISDFTNRQSHARREEGGPRLRGVASPKRGEADLGNTTKFTDKFVPTNGLKRQQNQWVTETIDPETGEIKSFGYNEKRESWAETYNEDAAMLDRWMLQKHSQRILSRPQYWQDRAKQSKVPYTDLTAKVKYCDIKTRKVISVLATSIGCPQVRNKHYDIEGTLNKAPSFRVVSCCRRKRDKSHQPELYRSKDTGSVSWHNLGVCGSTWTCPICSPKINLQRREEIKRCYDAVGSVGGVSYMLTFTIKHGIGDELKPLVEKFKDAMQRFQKSYAFKEVTRSQPLKRPRAGSLGYLGYIGRIANLEATHGQVNGWHPHEHHLWFFRRELTGRQINEIRNSLFDAWETACVQAGLPPPRKTIKVGKTVKFLGLDIRRALTAEEYITKFGALAERRWGPEKELASSHAKQARAKGRTPFQILADAAEGCKPSANKWCEFAEAFFGKHQLQFSRSLKTFLAEHEIYIDESEEGDILAASKLEERADLLGELDDDMFDRVVRNNAQGDVLVVARRLGFVEAMRFICALPGPEIAVASSVEYSVPHVFPPRVQAPRRQAPRGQSSDVYRLFYGKIETPPSKTPCPSGSSPD